MATSSLRKVLDLKVWQALAPSPASSAANMFCTESYGPDQFSYYITSTTGVYCYDPNEDGWITLSSPALATFSAGATGKWHPLGPSGTAVAGSTSTTLNTNLTILADLSTKNGLYFRVRITGGTGAGQERLIASSTTGANSIITVTQAWSVTPDATSTYNLYTGRVWILGAGTLAAGSFKYWDYATQTWSGNLTITGLPASVGTDATLVAPNSIISTASFTGTATGGTATTLVNSAKTWTVNQFANWQVRIIAGTGAGGIRLITSNTATTLTIASGTAIDNTSQYVIEPADNYLYLFGNAAVAAYRYSISGAAWSTLSPTAARAAAPAAGMSANWICGATNTLWNSESAVINGNRIYSFRGGGSTAVDYYDIAQNTWVSGITYGSAGDAPSSGSGFTYDNGNYIYFHMAQASGSNQSRWLRFDPTIPRMDAWSVHAFPAVSAAVLGSKVWLSQYYDGSGQTLKFVNMMNPGTNLSYRCLIW